MSKRKTTEQFIAEAIAIHGNKYDYSKVDYVGNKSKVCILCPIHGEFWQQAEKHLIGCGCTKCYDERRGDSIRLTKEEFIQRANVIHNNKYDYSLVEYKNGMTKVDIICPIHGVFKQRPNMHIRRDGCPKCGNENKRKMKFGLAYYDVDEPMTAEDNFRIYTIWQAMLRRCYSGIVHKKYPRYKDCSVCKEWLLFSNFKKWYKENNPEGFCIDKDILIKGNKVYSPDTCCCVPNEINILFSHKPKKSVLPVGVKHVRGGKFTSSIRKGEIEKYLGRYSTPEEAFRAYKEAKEAWIKEVADKWKDKLAPNVYEALYNYEVEITD